MYRICVTDHFDSAHHLRGYVGLCARQHGHSFLVRVYLEGEKLDKLGMLVDFKEIKSSLKDIVDRLDHRDLNDLIEFENKNPTAENIAKLIWDSLPPIVPPITGMTVRIYESVNCWAEYNG